MVLKPFGMNVGAAHRDIKEHSEFQTDGQRISQIINDGYFSYLRLCWVIIDNMKALLANRFSKILKVMFSSIQTSET